jgi:hypothetical protein
VLACPLDEPAAAGHGYGPVVVSLFLRLVLEAGVSLRGVPRVLATINEVLGLSLPVPCWTTGRLWLLRLGHARLTAPHEQGDDWAWLVDHSVQIGKDKCLVILGIRLRDLPERGESLRHQDMGLIELKPASSWTRAQVDEALEQAAVRTGITPRVIVSDHGSDISGGIALFQQRHRQTADIYDAKHKAACLLKHRLENNPRWREFQTRVAQVRCAIQQTGLAFLTPPAPRPKARFMNLGPQLNWARRVLVILDDPSAVGQFAAAGRLKEKLGWMETFRADVIEWSQLQQVVDVTVTEVNCQGLYRGAATRLRKQLSQLDALGDSAAGLTKELVQFVSSQESQVRRGERFPGSTEILESGFGKYKQLEKQQSRGGFTQLLLGFGAMLTKATTDVVREAMKTSRTMDIRRWAAQTLGLTLFAQRKLAYACATEDG